MVLPSCEMSQFRELKTKCSRSEYRKPMVSVMDDTALIWLLYICVLNHF